MHGLRRHRLAWLAPAGWPPLLQGHGLDAQVQDCLVHAAAHDWPLVVTRQPRPPAEGARPLLALGLAAPARWGRRAIAVQVEAAHVRSLGDFPPLAGVVVAQRLPPACGALADALQALGVVARVYGSHGWQQLTGLPCTHALSDLDLLLPVEDAAQADAVCAVLLQAATSGPRLDGELAFAGGGEVAWREWAHARGGHASQVLVKGLHGAALQVVDTRAATPANRMPA